MSNLMEQHQLLRTKIIERAIHINNMLHELYLPVGIYLHDVDYCGYSSEDLWDSSLNGLTTIQLIYHVPYEDYDETWEIPSGYIDMTDEDICKDFIKRYTEQSDRNKLHKIDLLKREAEYLGYDLVEKKL